MSWTHRAFSVINFLLKVWNCHHYSQFGTACVTHKGLGKGFRWKWGEFLGDCEMCFQHILAAMKDYTTCGGFITSIRKKRKSWVYTSIFCASFCHTLWADTVLAPAVISIYQKAFFYVRMTRCWINTNERHMQTFFQGGFQAKKGVKSP